MKTGVNRDLGDFRSAPDLICLVTRKYPEGHGLG